MRHQQFSGFSRTVSHAMGNAYRHACANSSASRATDRYNNRRRASGSQGELRHEGGSLMADLNPLNWNWSQAKAAGRNAASYAAGGVTVLVAMHYISPTQGTDITTNINLLLDGATKVATAIAGLSAILLPVYTAWRAANSASPSNQVKNVITELSASDITQAANAVADPKSRQNLIEAVADMPEVKKIVSSDPKIAQAIPSPKVTTQ